MILDKRVSVLVIPETAREQRAVIDYCQEDGNIVWQGQEGGNILVTPNDPSNIDSLIQDLSNL